jgi:serine/threonine protein kinase
MLNGETVSGQEYSWSLLKKLGEGDAGEVFLVESLLERKIAILKRPRPSAFSSDVIRQAAQIAGEARALRALSNISTTSSIPATKNTTVNVQERSSLASHPERTELAYRLGFPQVLDQSPPGTEFSERFFIIISRALGVSLNDFARAAHQGQSGDGDFTPDALALLQACAGNGAAPRLTLLRALDGVLACFDHIHHLPAASEGAESDSLIWNDVKLDHIFYDPKTERLTLIDWGNAQFIGPDGYTHDRHLSSNHDYAQFIQVFGNFLPTIDPDLYAILEWPGDLSPLQSYSEVLKPLRAKIASLLRQELRGMHDARLGEAQLLRSPFPTPDDLTQLTNLQEKLHSYGEYPDYVGARDFCTLLATQLVSADNLEEFTRLSSKACHMHADQPEKWQLLAQVAQTALSSPSESRANFLKAIQAGLQDDWADLSWELLLVTTNSYEPAWWDEITYQVRRVGIGMQPEALPPLTILRRLALSLQATVQRLRDGAPRGPGSAPLGSPAGEEDSETQRRLESTEALIQVLKSEVIAKYSLTEPDPPDSGLEYTDIDRLQAQIAELSPETVTPLATSLDQPRAQVKIVLDAWGRKDFEAARRGLSQVLLWDPDRRRVLSTERAIQSTPAWLEKVRQGPAKNQLLHEFVTLSELTGRGIRNQVGPTRWLELILDAFTQMRKGRKPHEALFERPELLNEMPWLDDYNPRKYVPAGKARALKLDREPGVLLPEPLVNGVEQSRLGSQGDLLLAEPLDTWTPVALGSSARAFIGFLRSQSGGLKAVAIKVMRQDRADYALPLFQEEVRVLTMLRDVPGLTPLLESGFILPDQGMELPPDNRPLAARSLNGDVLRYAPDQVHNFQLALESKTNEGWLPYLAMEKRNYEDNLMLMCDAGYTRGQFLPVEDSLRLAIQICEILDAAHQRNIVYRDHKILHYYWQEIYNGVFVIDWNVARHHPEGLSRAEKQFDLVQFGARALHHIFTGRVAPGALPDGPNRPEDIEAAAHSYVAQWTYDDQRLPPELKDLIESLLAGNYTRAGELREDLYQIYTRLTRPDNQENETEQ